jgi:hypothetical protein
LSQSDPTDHALAAIASILDHPESHREAERAGVEDSPLSLTPPEADGYSKVGPGPIAAIRFKWTVRRAADDDYFVDETIGENSVPAISGPMTKDAAIRLVDDRATEARQRYEALKNEMAGRSAAALLLHKGGGDF